MAEEAQLQRLSVAIRGAVQGVGFRPFVYRLATELGLNGWVNNSSQGVFIEVEGDAHTLEGFLRRLDVEKPANSFIQYMESATLDPVGFDSFTIRESTDGARSALILPDLATCPECLSEMLDPTNRRYRYPFTNCTHCGPRFTIVESLPYDRPKTTMKGFPMCPECRREYENPLDRRFHAQPNACPVCGPHLELWDPTGAVLAQHDDALLAAVEAVREGKIVAVKGLGGFHLVVDARDDEAVKRLRRRKQREEKPFALMFPDLDAIRRECDLSTTEAAILGSPASPVVLLHRLTMPEGREAPSVIAPSVAPGNPSLGVMVPYTPLHHLLLRELGFPVVATSGNLSDEPICIDEHEALERLSGIADLLLVHNRPIARHVDDSVVRVVAGRELVIRRARGYAPLPVSLKRKLPPMLAVGAHLKNTVALSVDRDVFISQHIGDLETTQAFGAFREVIGQFRGLYDRPLDAVVCDLHPDYVSTGYAHKLGATVVPVQHHAAHVFACLAENEVEGPALGISWDGTGFGTDGTVWGGEFIRVEEGRWERNYSLRTFPLPGGEKAVREPRRTALGLLYEHLGETVFERLDLAPLQAFSDSERSVLRTMLARGVNVPHTSSMGRLFDAVASLTGLRQIMSFEGQAAMELEWAQNGTLTHAVYPFEIGPSANGEENGLSRVDWAPLVDALLDDLSGGVATEVIAATFHNTLVDLILAVAHLAGEETVALTGGCFQNRTLCERAIDGLRRDGFRPVWHRRVPPNDAGVALGQIVAAARSLERG